jgi:Holliday junction resolvase
MTPEGKVKAKVRKLLAEGKYYYTMPVTGGYGVSGVPDFIVCVKGKFLAIECKANGGKTTALQDKHLNDIKTSGGVALVINENDLDYLKQILTSMEHIYE